jgi:hypothetical protein
MSTVLHLAAAVEETHPLPMDPLAFAAIAMLAFISLLGLTWSFRNTSNRQR